MNLNFAQGWWCIAWNKAGYRIQDARCKMQDARCKMQDARYFDNAAHLQIRRLAIKFCILHLASRIL
ncbi:MAG: hypothetical protein WCO02_02515 [Bacteroidota bacterium]